jgi:hypothetical protein
MGYFDTGIDRNWPGGGGERGAKVHHYDIDNEVSRDNRSIQYRDVAKSKKNQNPKPLCLNSTGCCHSKRVASLVTSRLVLITTMVTSLNGSGLVIECWRSAQHDMGLDCNKFDLD